MLYVTQYLYQYELRPDAFLILNTLTGALDVVPERLSTLLKPRAEIDPASLIPEETQMLLDRGYLLPADDERARVGQWFDDFKQRLRSWHFIVCPTFSCNLRCPYCFEGLEIRQSKTRQTRTQVDDMFLAMEDLIAERQANYVEIELYGGEPFLRSNRDTVAAIMRQARSKGWKISGITNATQLDAYFDLFEECAGSIEQLQITMDGPREIHNRLRIYANGKGTYEEICDNVSGALTRGVAVVLRVNVGPDNVPHLPRLFEAFETNGWTKYEDFVCMLSPVTDHHCTGCVSNYQPEFQLLGQLHELMGDWEAARERYHISMGYDIERRTYLLRQAIFGKTSRAVRTRDLSGCSASNQHYLVFGADGLLYSCPETVGMPEVAIGRYSPEFKLDRARWAQWDINISNTSKCASCSIAPVCGGACPWQGVNSSSFDAYVPHCNYASQTIKSYLDLNRDHILRMIDS